MISLNPMIHFGVFGKAEKSILSMMRLAAVAGVAIAMGDYLVQRRRFEKSIKMSKHDIKRPR